MSQKHSPFLALPQTCKMRFYPREHRQWRFTLSHVTQVNTVRKKKFARAQMSQNWVNITCFSHFSQKLLNFWTPQNMKKLKFYLRKHRQNPRNIVITRVLCLPRRQKHCKYHVSQSWWIHKIATTTRSVPDPAGCFCYQTMVALPSRRLESQQPRISPGMVNNCASLLVNLMGKITRNGS